MQSGTFNGAKCAELREKRLKITMASLAERVGVTEATISRIETGERQPSAALLQRLCKVLGVHPSDLFLGEIGIFNGAKCRELRKKHLRTTMKGLAKLVDSSESHIFSLESGERQPSAELFARLCEVLGVSDPSELLLDE